jgi:hypothetical protein
MVVTPASLSAERHTRLRPSVVALVAACVFVVTLAFYVCQEQFVYSGDDLQYLMAVDSAVSLSAFYHPSGERSYQPAISTGTEDFAHPPLNLRYPLELPTSIWFVTLWGPSDVMGSLRLLRAVAGAIGVTFLLAAIWRLSGSFVVAIIPALGLATSLAYRDAASHFDYSINVTALTMLAVFLLVVSDTSRRSTLWLMGAAVAQGLATLFMITAVIAAAMTTLWLWWDDRHRRAPVRRALWFGLAYAVALALTGTLLAIANGHAADVLSGEFLRRSAYVGYPEYNVSFVSDAAKTVIGLPRSLVSPPFGDEPLSQYWHQGLTARVSIVSLYGSLAVVTILPVGFLMVRRRLLARPLRFWLPWTAWLVGYVLFNWFWIPSYTKFWVMPLAIWWLLAGTALAHARTTVSRAMLVGCAALFVAFVAAINEYREFGPHNDPRANPWRRVAEQLRATPANALFVSPAHPLDFHIAYFTHRDVVSTGLIGYANRNDQNAVRRIVMSHVDAHVKDSGPLLLYGVDALAAAERQSFLAMLPRGRLAVARAFPEVTVYELVPESLQTRSAFVPRGGLMSEARPSLAADR